jgi:hypothetical protein
MSDDPFQPEEDRPRRGRYQFGLATMLFLAIPVGLLAGAWNMLTASRPGDPRFWFGLVLVAAAPMALAILMSLYLKLRR